MCPDVKVKWSKGPVRVLGIKTTSNPNDLHELNYKPAKLSIENILKSWRQRGLTVPGKIVIIKSLALSQITHLFATLPSPSNKFLNELESALYKFIWNGKPDKIKRKTLIGT